MCSCNMKLVNCGCSLLSLYSLSSTCLPCFHLLVPRHLLNTALDAPLEKQNCCREEGKQWPNVIWKQQQCLESSGPHCCSYWCSCFQSFRRPTGVSPISGNTPQASCDIYSETRFKWSFIEHLIPNVWPCMHMHVCRGVYYVFAVSTVQIGIKALYLFVEKQREN